MVDIYYNKQGGMVAPNERYGKLGKARNCGHLRGSYLYTPSCCAPVPTMRSTCHGTGRLAGGSAATRKKSVEGMGSFLVGRSTNRAPGSEQDWLPPWVFQAATLRGRKQMQFGWEQGASKHKISQPAKIILNSTQNLSQVQFRPEQTTMGLDLKCKKSLHP